MLDGIVRAGGGAYHRVKRVKAGVALGIIKRTYALRDIHHAVMILPARHADRKPVLAKRLRGKPADDPIADHKDIFAARFLQEGEGAQRNRAFLA